MYLYTNIVYLFSVHIFSFSSESPFSNVELGEPLTPLDAERLNHGIWLTSCIGESVYDDIITHNVDTLCCYRGICNAICNLA